LDDECTPDSRDEGANPPERTPRPDEDKFEELNAVALPDEETVRPVTRDTRLPWPETDASPPVIPPRAYKTLGTLGEGGMARVLLVEDPAFDREVAMKVAFREIHEKPASLQRFLNEARITGQLDHPSIPPAYDAGKGPDGRFYFTMKRVAGESLADMFLALEDEEEAAVAEYTLFRLLSVFEKVCEAAAFAHDQGVVHRDLKPENVMVGRFGQVFVMDWGLARVSGEEEIPAGDGVLGKKPKSVSARPVGSVYGSVIGTPGYMSPEQVEGKMDLVDPVSDVYSLGAILYEILTLEKAFDGKTVKELLIQNLQGEILPPRARAPRRGVPRALQAICLKAMARSRDDRYGSALALARDVRAYMEQRPVSAYREPLSARAWKWVRKHDKALMAAAAVILVAAAGTGFGIRYARSARLASRVEAFRVLEREAAGIRESIDDGAYEKAISATDGLLARLPDVLPGLLADPALREGAPEVVDRVQAFPERVRRSRADAVLAWATACAREIETPPGSATPGAIERVKSHFERFRAYLPDLPPKTADRTPVASFALWLARAALAREAGARELPETSRWVARAFIAQPASREAGRALLLLADHSLEISGEEMDPEKALLAATQYHLAYGAFGRDYPRLKIDALFGLAVALSRLGAEARAPFDPALSARHASLRCLLSLMDAQGCLRPAVASALGPEEASALQREAGDLLFALSRISSWTPIHEDPFAFTGNVVDADGDGAKDAVVLHDSQDPLTLHVHQIAEPARHGGPPILEPVEEIRLRGRIARHVPGVSTEELSADQLWRVRLLADGPPQYAFGLSTKDRSQNVLVVLKRPDSPSPLLFDRYASGGLHHESVVVEDLDGDGLQDLLVGLRCYHRRAYVYFQGPEPGAFRRVPVPDTTNGSDVTAMLAEDLDGDGEKELAVLRGPFNDFSLEVYRVEGEGDGDGRGLESICRVDTAVSRRVAPLRTDAGTLLFLASHIGDLGTFRSFEFLERPVPPVGFRAFRWAGEGLEPLARADAARPFDPGARYFDLDALAGGPVSGVGRTAFMEVGFRQDRIGGGHCGFWRWRFWPEATFTDAPLRTLEIPDAGKRGGPAGVAISSAFTGSDGRGYVAINGALFRSLDARDLEALAGPVRPSPPVPGATPSVALCRFLLAFDLPAAAVDLARDALGKESSSETALELRRLEIAGLVESGEAGALKALLLDLAVQGSLAATVGSAAEWLALEREEYGFSANLLARWGGSDRVQARERERLARRAAFWTSVEERLEKTAVAVSGTRLSTRQGDCEVWDRLLTNAPDAVRPAPGGGGSVLRFHLHRRNAVVLAPGGSGEKTEVRSAGFFWGVPVRYAGGPWKLVLEATIDGAPWWSGFRLGLIGAGTLDGGPGRWRLTGSCVTFSCGGGNEVNTVRAGSAGTILAIDALLGKPLRVEVVQIPSARRHRVTIRTVGDGRVVYARVLSGIEPVAGGHYLFGVFSGTPNGMEGHLKHFGIAGDVDLLPPSDPWQRGFLVSASNVGPVSRAVRHRARGSWDDSATAFEEAAMLYGSAATSTAPGSRYRALLGQLAGEMRLEAAWARAREDAGTFASGQADALADPAKRTVLVKWLLGGPEHFRREGLWEACGAALARARHPGCSAAEVRRALEDEEREYEALREAFLEGRTREAYQRVLQKQSSLETCEAAVIGLWLLSRSRGEEALVRLVARFLRLIGEDGIVVSMTEDLLSVRAGEERAALLGYRASALSALNRREEALQAIVMGGAEPERHSRSFLELMVDLRRRQVEHAAEEAGSR